MPRASIKMFPMSEDDLPEVMAIERVSFSEPWTEEGFREELVRPLSHVYVAKAGTDISSCVCGYVCFWILLDELHILNLAVHPGHRVLGVGRALLEWALDRGRSARVEVAILEVRPSNTAAIQLYRGAGFREVARRPRYYSDSGEEAIIMELRL